MAFKYVVVTQNAVTTGYTQDFTDSQFDGDVKGAIAFAGYSTNQGALQDNLALAIGMFDGTNYGCGGIRAEHGETKSDAGKRSSTGKFLYVTDVNAGRVLQATASILTNGIRLDFDGRTPSRAIEIVMIILGGDCELSKIMHTPPTVIDDSNTATFSGVTLGAQDRACVFCLNMNTTSVDNTEKDHAEMSFGVMVNDGSATQASFGLAYNNDFPDSATYFGTTRMGLALNSQTHALRNAIEGSAFSGSQITVTSRGTDSPSTQLHLMALQLTGEDRLGLKQIQSPTGTGEVSYTGLGFQNENLILVGTDTTSADTVASDVNCTMTLGAWDSDGNIGSISGCVDGNASPTDVASYAAASIALIDELGNVDDVGTKATTQSSDGFTVNWTSADATQRRAWGLSIGPVSGAGGTNRSLRGMGGVAKIGNLDGILGYWP